MLIKKVKQIIPVVAKVVQSLTSNSETDVPSVKAVNEGLNNINQTLNNWGNTTSLNDYTGDLNDIKQTSYCTVGSVATNKPDSSNYYVLTLVKNPDYYITQIAITRDNSTPKVYMRVRMENNWYDWVEK